MNKPQVYTVTFLTTATFVVENKKELSEAIERFCELTYHEDGLSKAVQHTDPVRIKEADLKTELTADKVGILYNTDEPRGNPAWPWAPKIVRMCRFEKEAIKKHGSAGKIFAYFLGKR